MLNYSSTHSGSDFGQRFISFENFVRTNTWGHPEALHTTIDSRQEKDISDPAHCIVHQRCKPLQCECVGFRYGREREVEQLENYKEGWIWKGWRGTA